MARPKRSESEGLAQQTRELLLEAATATFAAEGYDGANVNAISRQAGFGKGTIYNYFPSKRQLMLAVLTAASGAHCAAVGERVLATDGVEARLQEFFAAGFDFVTTHLPQARVALETVFGHDTELKEHLWQGYAPMFELVAREIIGAGIAEGIFAQCDPVATANLIMTIYLGAGSQVNEDGQTWLDAADLAAFVGRALAAREGQGTKVQREQG